mgnify:CR=1 FL=1
MNKETKFVEKWGLSGSNAKTAAECLQDSLEESDYYAGQIEELEAKVRNLIAFQLVIFEKISDRFSAQELADYFHKDILTTSDEDEI